MNLCWIGTFPESMVQQQQQHRVSWVGWVGGGPKHYVDTPTRVELG